jgi:hypothetical protein
VASETRLRVLEQLDGSMLRVVGPDELPGDLALAFCDGSFLLFLTTDALRLRTARALAHEAVHMFTNMQACNAACGDATDRVESLLSVVFAFSHLA